MGTCPYCLKSVGFFRKVHKECESNYNEGKKIIEQKSLDFFNNNDTVEIEELEQIADDSFISYGEFVNIMERSFTKKLEDYLDDGVLSVTEETTLAKYIIHFKLTEEQLNKNGSMTKSVQASLIRKLLSGEELTNRMDITENLPFKFQKNEYLIWLFQNVELFEQRIKTTYEGGSHGISIRIVKGLYYRTSRFKGNPVKTTNFVPISTGWFAFTNKHIYFSSRTKNFRIKYEKIITLQPYSDGIGVTKDGVTSKPQIFKNIDGWFCYNFLKNI